MARFLEEQAGMANIVVIGVLMGIAFFIIFAWHTYHRAVISDIVLNTDVAAATRVATDQHGQGVYHLYGVTVIDPAAAQLRFTEALRFILPGAWANGLQVTKFIVYEPPSSDYESYTPVPAGTVPTPATAPDGTPVNGPGVYAQVVVPWAGYMPVGLALKWQMVQMMGQAVAQAPVYNVSGSAWAGVGN